MPLANTNGTKLADGADIAPINLIAHSAFSLIDSNVNERLITQSSNLYAFRSNMAHFLSYGSDAKSTHLTAAGWYADTPAW